MAPGSLDRQSQSALTHIGRGFYGSMSAVSSGSPQGNAEVRQPEASQEPGPLSQPVSAPHRAGESPGRAAPDHANQADFGANEWLVEELYQRYLADPGSVDRAWWSFFADYQPTLPNGTGPQPVIGLQGAPQAPAPQTVPPQTAPPQSPRRPDRRVPRARRRRAPSRPRPKSPLPRPLGRLPARRRPLSAAQLRPLRHPQLCLLPQPQLCLLPQPHPKVPRSAGCAAPRRAPSPT